MSRRAFSPPDRLDTGVSDFDPPKPKRAARARAFATGTSGIRAATWS